MRYCIRSSRQQKRKRNYATCYELILWAFDYSLGQNSTGAKWYSCPGSSVGTGAIFPLSLWSRRLCLCCCLRGE